jgi:hypothetical protein
MSRARQIFRQRDIAKALKGVLSAGVDVTGVEIAADGTIRVLVGKPQMIQDAAHSVSVNEWDSA